MINMCIKENRGIVCWPVLVHRPVEHKTKRASSYHHSFHHHHHHIIILNIITNMWVATYLDRQSLNDVTKIWPKPIPRLFSIPNFPKPWLFFWDEIFRNGNRYFFPGPNSSKPKPKPSRNWQKFWNREVSKPKCQSLPPIYHRHEGPDFNKASHILVDLPSAQIQIQKKHNHQNTNTKPPIFSLTR